ncbi:MAG: hypothetical protein H7249_06800 [Chitinophagaceae bacterium]|nr:hypothetical protein [Oligoflexus sp.]
MKRSGIYWLCSSIEEVHQRRASILDDIGYQVYFFENLEALIKEICVKRAKILILGDEWPSDVAIKHIQTFANIPDIIGARLLLSNSRNDYELMRAASMEGFRDIIPTDLEDSEWLQRFEFATSGMESILDIHSDLKKFEEKIEINIPARVVWIGPQTLWIESKTIAAVGDTIAIRGAFAERFGLNEINAVVIERQKSHLSYRFSEALVVNWAKDVMARAEPTAIKETIEYLGRVDLGLRPKIFLAIQSPALRTTILRYADRRKYEVHTALQKNSLVYEPRFFTPDLIFIEEQMTNGEGHHAFLEMVRYLPEHATIVTIGSRYEGTDIKGSTGNRRMRSLRHIPTNLAELIERDYLAAFHLKKPEAQSNRLAFLPHDHALSYALVSAEAKLQSADYLQFEISSTSRINTYSLLKVQGSKLSTILGGPAYLKVVASCDPDDAVLEPPYRFKAHLCNLVEPVRAALSKTPRVKAAKA